MPKAGTEPKVDSRPCDQFLADAAAKLLCPAFPIYRHVLEVAVEQGHVPDRLRDDDQILADVTHLYRTRRVWVQQVVIGYVRSHTKSGQTAA